MRRLWAWTWISIIVDSSVPGNGRKAFPQVGQCFAASLTSYTSATTGRADHIPSDLVVVRRFSHHMLDLSMRYLHDVSSSPTAICMEMRHGTDRQSDTRKPHPHR